MCALILSLVGVGWILAAAVMALLWLWHLKLRNAGIVDGGWAFLVGGLAVLYAVLGDGWTPRRTAIAFMMGSWGARLTVYLLYDRVFGRSEDGRYADLRRRHGDGANAWFFGLFEAQAAAAVFFSLPALLAAVNTHVGFSLFEFAAAPLWIVAYAGEVTADRQLERFRADPGNHGRTCQQGLWRYSRHPNYFFEWLIWLAYATFASASAWGWIAFVCPLAMMVLLFKVTGIPATEARALRSRGDEYREYQRTTSVFVPWFPKRRETAETAEKAK
jgi:steroid 5-alpha reductase family enzyme